MGIIERYNFNKKQALGERIRCPVCDSIFIKKKKVQAFCRLRKSRCKNAFWNYKRDGGAIVKDGKPHWLNNEDRLTDEDGEIAQGLDYLSECGDK